MTHTPMSPPSSNLLQLALRTRDFCERLNDRVGRAVSWLSLVMVLTSFVIVVLRYFFNTGWPSMQESVLYMHAMLFMLGAAYTLGRGGHVRVDIFYRRYSVRKRALVDMLGTLLLLFPVAIFIYWSSLDFVARSWGCRDGFGVCIQTLWNDEAGLWQALSAHKMEGSGDTGGIPAMFLFKSLVPVMALLLMVQGLSMVIANALILLGVEQKESGEGHH